ncbi:MAG TPA: phosphoenolpyruvate carboxykinase (GTP) [Ktedonobacterales bacterium]|jgi:phosphoenolpyruvate carboxykinase (GTP)|nr:phosphoenolpyruvate carboxykinase (GTP) [Ktedonobacterales bacterium]
MSSRTALEAWVDECARLTQPDRIVWCDGSEQEYQRLIETMLQDGSMQRLNPQSYPNSYLYHSDPTDVARTEEVTFICTTREEDAGPTNNWMAPEEAKAKVRPIFDGSMRGRTMYVVPYLMGPQGSPLMKVGVEVTDSPYVAVSMRIMTRMGQVALESLDANGGEFVPGLHCTGNLDPNQRYILHFPEENLIWSVGSGYGGNALLGKKCLSLRLASWMSWKNGWLAEHMLILGLEDPTGNVTYMAGAFPSACGKTNLAMLVSPLAEQGWKVWTLGDDIAWMRIGEDGRLWAVNPEHGFFGVAPGTNTKTNPNAMATLSRNSIFTNVAVTPDDEPWWEGIDPDHKTPPAGTIDWLGKPWEPGNGLAAHPNSRFTAPAGQCPSISPRWEDPQGVPISAFIFGGRRAHVAPLVYQAFDWQHGVFVGASMASETTAAATGNVGVVRRDPMAMLPFCGYNMGDYWQHWLDMGKNLTNPPQIFHVNWFRKDDEGKFLWPGFGQNVRVLMWMLERINGGGKAVETPIGYTPTPDGLDLDGLDISQNTMKALLQIDPKQWQEEWAEQRPFFEKFGAHLPPAIEHEHRALGKRLSEAV